MKKLYFPKLEGKLVILLVIFAGILSQSLRAQDEEDKTLSPYFFVMSPDTSIDQMPLKSTSADVNVSGVIANVSVKQTYCNEGDSVLEAIYVFPASTRAAVHYMQMSLGNRILIAEIKEKEEAQQIYDSAVAEGRTATLLEQERPNVFKMSVGNILPGDTIEIEMRYTELLVPLEGEYEFVYPTVVGPRYVSPSEDGESWTDTPYQHEGEDPLYDFHFNICINAGMEIKDVYSASNPDMIFSGETKLTACASEDLSGNKDVVVRYRLSGAQIESGMLTYEGDNENFFLAMFQPPKNPQDYQVPPREYVFIMDVSGSMRGIPIDVSKAILTDLVSGLREQDRFNIVFFAGGNYSFSPSSLPATQENITLALNAINNELGGGGTELLSALTTALALPGMENYARTFAILTDGYISVERESFDLIRNNLGKANFFAFGIGSSSNRYLIEGIAHVGMGEPFFAPEDLSAELVGERFRKYIEYPVLTNIEVDFTTFGIYDVEPPNVPDVFAERPVILFGKYQGDLTGTIKIKGLSGTQDYSEELDVSQYKADPKNEALRYLWARHRIQLLDDFGEVRSIDWMNEEAYQDSIQNEIIELGLKYNLLTRYTSFIAVDSLIRADSGQAVTVKQPLPMPEGVTDNALGEGVWQSGGFAGMPLGNESIYLAENDGNSIPDRSRISEVYPNPFNAGISLRIFIHSNDIAESKTLKLYNALGQMVDEIELFATEEGWQVIELDFNSEYPGLESGLYTAIIFIGETKTEPVQLMYIK